MSKAGLDLGNVELSGQSAPNDHRRVAGIKLSTLPRRISRMLSDWSRYIKIRSVGPRALLCQAILHEAHHVCRRKGFAVPFVNRMVVMPRGDGTIGEKWEAVRDMHTIGWKCAYCKLPIRAEVGDLSAANLCCPQVLLEVRRRRGSRIEGGPHHPEQRRLHRRLRCEVRRAEGVHS